MKVFTTINPDYIANIYFVTDDEQKYGFIINPGTFAFGVYELIKYTGAEINGIIVTHNGIEQTDGIPLIKKIYMMQRYTHIVKKLRDLML